MECNAAVFVYMVAYGQCHLEKTKQKCYLVCAASSSECLLSKRVHRAEHESNVT